MLPVWSYCRKLFTASSLETEAARFRPNNFDLIRLFAALQVIIGHFSHRMNVALPAYLNFLFVFPGVPIFFVTSGYLVSASYERQQTRFSQYLRNRFLRIYPGLWACLSLTFLTVLILGFRPMRFFDFLWLPLQMAGAIFTPAFLKAFGSGTYNGSLWTIPIELQFYLMAPLLYWIVRKLRLGNRGFVLLFLLATAFALLQSALWPFADLYGQTEPTRIKLLRYSFAPHIYLFLLGILLQRFQCYRWPLLRGKAWIWLPLYTLISVQFPYQQVTNVFRFLLLGLVILSLAYTATGLGERLLRGQDISYGAYIYHGLILNLLIALAIKPSLGLLVGVLAATIVLATLSWKLVEQPCLRLKMRRGEAATRDLCITEFKEPIPETR